MIGWGDSRPCFLAMAVVVGPEVVVVNLIFVCCPGAKTDSLSERRDSGSGIRKGSQGSKKSLWNSH